MKKTGTCFSSVSCQFSIMSFFWVTFTSEMICKFCKIFIIFALSLVLALEISVACVCNFLWWIVTDLSFFSSSWRDVMKTLYKFCNAFSWISIIRLFHLLRWNIHTNAYYPYWQRMREFIKTLRGLKSI